MRTCSNTCIDQHRTISHHDLCLHTIAPGLVLAQTAATEVLGAAGLKTLDRSGAILPPQHTHTRSITCVVCGGACASATDATAGCFGAESADMQDGEKRRRKAHNAHNHHGMFMFCSWNTVTCTSEDQLETYINVWMYVCACM